MKIYGNFPFLAIFIIFILELNFPLCVFGQNLSNQTNQTADKVAAEASRSPITQSYPVNLLDSIKDISLDIMKNNPEKIILIQDDWEKDYSLLINIVDEPANGTLSNDHSETGYITYRPDNDYIGSDTFSFDVINNDTFDIIEHDVGVYLNVKAEPIVDIDPMYRAGVAFSLAFIIVIIVLFVAVWLIQRAKTKDTIFSMGRIWISDIIRGPDLDPSLSIFQFLLWTIVVLFSFTGIYLTRIFGGVIEFPSGGIPVAVLAIMGISITVPIASSLISSYKQSYDVKSDPAKLDETSRTMDVSKVSGSNENRVSLSAMLMEDGRPTLSRFQMFAWTWISIIIYFFVLFSSVSELSNQVQRLNLPDIDPTFVYLMGLSQIAFLGGKATNAKFGISAIYPPRARKGQHIQIFGSNFGKDTDTVWFNDKAIRLKEAIQEGTNWGNGRIDLNVPDLPGGEYIVRVAKAGLLSEGKKFEISEDADEAAADK